MRKNRTQIRTATPWPGDRFRCLKPIEDSLSTRSVEQQSFRPQDNGLQTLQRYARRSGGPVNVILGTNLPMTPIGYDRWLKANTVKTRTHSLFRQGLMLYQHIPTGPSIGCAHWSRILHTCSSSNACTVKISGTLDDENEGMFKPSTRCPTPTRHTHAVMVPHVRSQSPGYTSVHLEPICGLR